jgi:polar amino acid transport system substrate-binding protein
MGRARRRVVAVLLAAACAPAHAGPAMPHLYLTTETAIPISMLEGSEVIGSATDKVKEVMARTGIGYTIDLLPWKRAYTLALQRPDACIYSTTRTPEREKLFKWVGPTEEAEWVLLGRADRGFQLRSLDDARALRIGTYNGDARDHYLRSRGFQVDSAPDDLTNPRKLMLNRVDLWAASLRRSSAMLQRNGWDKRIVPVLSFNHVKIYLACNPAVPDELIDRMNAAVEAMERDGTMKRLERKYEHWHPDQGAVQ